MNHHPCDQIAADCLAVKEKFNSENHCQITLMPSRAEEMIEMSERFADAETFTERLDLTLDRFEFVSDLERRAYKSLLGTIFKNRSAFSKRRKKAGKSAA